jgi:hypothetical protein
MTSLPIRDVTEEDEQYVGMCTNVCLHKATTSVSQEDEECMCCVSYSGTVNFRLILCFHRWVLEYVRGGGSYPMSFPCSPCRTCSLESEPHA